MAHWIRFFLVAINETAKKGVLTFQAIHQLRQITAAQVQTLGKRTANAQRVLDSLYIKPTVTSSSLAARLGVSQPTADRTIAEFQRLGILHELTGKRRNRVFYFKDYYQLFTS